MNPVDNGPACRHNHMVDQPRSCTATREWKQRKLDLAREYRQEKASYFRDLSMLNKDIRDTMLEYLKEKQMEEIFR